MKRSTAVPLLAAALALAPWTAGFAQQDANTTREREILQELVNINTGPSQHRTGEAAKVVARRLEAAGLPAADIQILALAPGVDSLVARYRGSGHGRPIMLMAHLDVVEALREDWSFDPFQFREADGYYYGRGTSDNKAGAATLVSNFIRYLEEGFVPSRDLILVLTGDEETSSDCIKALLKDHRDLVDADFALNTDAGGGLLVEDRPVSFEVQTAEKVYLSFQLEVRSKGGHSSVPEPDNAIYRLAAALGRVAHYAFPVKLNETTRTSLERLAPTQPAARGRAMRLVAKSADPAAARELSKVPVFNAQLRSSCVATRLFGGHADNALPQVARATVNCRMLPGDPPDGVQAALERVIADAEVHVSRVAEPTASPASPLRPDVMQPIEALVKAMWPTAIVTPEMSTGATDGLYVRNAGIPTYGIGAIFDRIDENRAHGRDERVRVKSYHDAARFWYSLVKTLSSAGSAAPGRGTVPLPGAAEV